MPKGVYEDDLDPYAIAKRMMPDMHWLYENGFLESLEYVLERGDETEKEDRLSIKGKVTLRGEEFIFMLIESEHAAFWDMLIKMLALTVEYRKERDEAQRSYAVLHSEHRRINEQHQRLLQENVSNLVKLKNLELAEVFQQTDLFRSSGLPPAANYKWN